MQAIWKMAVDSVGCEAGPVVEFEAQVMVEGLKQIRKAIEEIEEKIQEVCLQFPEYEFLLSIPGFGPDVSSKVLGAIGDPFRFQNGRQVLKMAGLDLSAERSGKTSASAIPVISKKGKADLRYALYQAAFIASIQESGLYRLLYPQAAGPRKRAWDQDQDAGQVGGQASDHCLDVDEEKGAF